MADRPHDVTDLYLAPALLAVDARIGELGKLGKDGLAYEVGLESDSADFTRHMREGALIRIITHLIDTHHWEFSCTRSARRAGASCGEGACSRVAAVMDIGSLRCGIRVPGACKQSPP